MIVVDASVCASWFLPDENPEALPGSFETFRRTGAVVPVIFPVEIRNVFVVALRRKRIRQTVLVELLSDLRSLNFAIDDEPDLDGAVGLAIAQGLSLYDALYLELALRRGARLASLDRRLREAAARLEISLV